MSMDAPRQAGGERVAVRLLTFKPSGPEWWVGPYEDEFKAQLALNDIDTTANVHESLIVEIHPLLGAWRIGMRTNNTLHRMPHTVSDVQNVLDEWNLKTMMGGES